MSYLVINALFPVELSLLHILASTWSNCTRHLTASHGTLSVTFNQHHTLPTGKTELEGIRVYANMQHPAPDFSFSTCHPHTRSPLTASPKLDSTSPSIQHTSPMSTNRDRTLAPIIPTSPHRYLKRTCHLALAQYYVNSIPTKRNIDHRAVTMYVDKQGVNDTSTVWRK